MKKIIEISIDNYKGYVQMETFKLPNGENLLIYGENGSGKSSLFHALKHFLHSSREQTIPFDMNVFSGKAHGKIELTFSDYDLATHKIVTGSESAYTARETPANSTNAQPFIQLGHRLSGFLDYSQLLKIYLNKEPRPNLFELINDLIGDFVPTAYGFSESMRDIFDIIHRNIHKSYHRKDKSYKEGINKFGILQIAYTHIINDLNKEFSKLMTDYFPNLNLGLQLGEVNISLHRKPRIREEKINGAIYLNVTHHGVVLNNYNARLNEARLSAIAICLYLASLKLRNKNAEIKLLYLDDVFIGLDSANRRPILNIIDKEFPDYQIFISTYDKNWFSLAKEVLNNSGCWKFIELYEGVIEVGTNKIVRPIIVEGRSYIDKAKTYMFDQLNPDYPAAANYMRKAFEELLSKKIYPSAIKDNNLEDTPGYKIPVLINRSKVFLKHLRNEPSAHIITKLLDKLITYLRPMLHPLSHYVPGVPVYKNELIEALNIYDQLLCAIETASYPSKLKPILSRDSIFKFEISGANWKQIYTLHADYDMFSYVDGNGNRTLSSCPMRTIEIEEIDTNSGKVSKFRISKNSKMGSTFAYENIDDCVSKITAHLKTPKENKADCVVLPDITNMFFLPKDNLSPISEKFYTEPLTKRL